MWRAGWAAAFAVTGAAATALSQDGGYDPFRAPGGAAASQAPRGQVASGEFVGAPIGDVLRVVSDLTGWSILMSPGAVAADPKVNLFVKDMRPEEVLEQTVNLAGLVLHRRGTTYQVMTFDEYARQFNVDRKVRQLEHVAAAEVVAILDQFVQGKDSVSKVAAAQSGNQVVLLAPEPLLAQLERLIDAIDVPFAQDRIEVVRLEHLEAPVVVPLLEQFLTQAVGGSGGGGAAGVSARPSPPPAQGGGVPAPAQAAAPADDTAEGGGKAGERLLVQFMVEPKLNAVVIRGLPGDVQRAVELLGKLDVPPGIEVVSYQLDYTDAAQVSDTLDRLLEERGTGGGRTAGEDRRVRVAVSEQNNRVIVEGTAEDQARMAAIVRAIDQPLPAGAGDIRVYRLENSTAEEVAAVLQEILLERDREDRRASVDSGEPRVGTLGRSGSSSPSGTAAGASATPPPRAPIASGAAAMMGGGTAVPLTGPNALPPRVTPAAEINAVIVRASAVEHEALAQVIEELDQPRDQVLVEVTLVTVSATETFNLGVEVGGSFDVGGADVVGFSTFGIGEVDPLTGALRIADPSPFGGNAAVINSDDFSLVLNALKTVGDVRISSVPKVLVEDNSPAEIRQVNEEPFEVTSQGGDSTVTSFGGFVEAGTQLTVTPHISSEDWLRLEYEVELSDFRQRTAQQLATNIPPPRTVNQSRGVVRIPSGRVVVLGGLASSRESGTRDAVPLLGDIPLVGELFKNRGSADRRDTLFIFIRPVLVRDPGFRDLLLLSEEEADRAGIEDRGYPANPLKLFGSSVEPTPPVEDPR